MSGLLVDKISQKRKASFAPKHPQDAQYFYRITEDISSEGTSGGL